MRWGEARYRNKHTAVISNSAVPGSACGGIVYSHFLHCQLVSLNEIKMLAMDTYHVDRIFKYILLVIVSIYTVVYVCM